MFMVRNRKIEHHHCIPLIQISLGTKFQLKLTILIFLTTFTQKRFFWSKTEKVNTTYFLHNSAYSNQSSAEFQPKLTVFIWIEFAQKDISSQNIEKVNIITEFWILKLVSWYHVFALTDNFDFFDQVFPKTVSLV